jgi:hypothetical protein
LLHHRIQQARSEAFNIDGGMDNSEQQQSLPRPRLGLRSLDALPNRSFFDINLIEMLAFKTSWAAIEAETMNHENNSVT